MNLDTLRVGEILEGPSGNRYRVLDIYHNHVIAAQLDHFVYNTPEVARLDATALQNFKKFSSIALDEPG